MAAEKQAVEESGLALRVEKFARILKIFHKKASSK
jgi:hypothetical protein